MITGFSDMMYPLTRSMAFWAASRPAQDIIILQYNVFHVRGIQNVLQCHAHDIPNDIVSHAEGIQNALQSVSA